MAKYRNKPMVIEAVEFMGFDGVAPFCERPSWLVEKFGKEILFFDKPNTLTIKTLKGDYIASVGDYIIKGVNGEIYPCKSDIFYNTYEIVDSEVIEC